MKISKQMQAKNQFKNGNSFFHKDKDKKGSIA